jgi:TonB family protein
VAGFEFLNHERPDSARASQALLTQLAAKLRQCLDRIHQPRGAMGQPQNASSANVIEINNPDEPTQAGSVEPPHILISSKPIYTRAAQMADVSATVDLKVTFLPNGTIGPIEVVRWAGFGLDESAIDAARKIKFRPARHNGQSIAARALVQYKFHLKTSAADADSFNPPHPSTVVKVKETLAFESNR